MEKPADANASAADGHLLSVIVTIQSCAGGRGAEAEARVLPSGPGAGAGP